jgi:hypothetical protein
MPLLICVVSAFTCEIAFAEPLYRFGVPPWQRGQSVDDIRRLYEPLLNYLGRATDAKITIVTARRPPLRLVSTDPVGEDTVRLTYVPA